MPNPDNKEKVRQGFTFFRSFRDAVAMTAPDEQLVLYKAIADYALDQIEPDVSTLGSLGRLCWTAIRPNIESGLIRFRNGCMGGAPKGNRNACKTTEKQAGNNRKTTDPILNEDKNENRTSGEDGRGCMSLAPTQKEIEAYITETGLKVDAGRFFNYYTANGWMIGRNRMKDWRAAVRNWAGRDEMVPAIASSLQTPSDDETRPKYQAL